MYYFMRKMLSDSMLDLAKCPNRKMHKSEPACFLLGHSPRSKIKSEKNSHKVCINYCSKFFLEAFLSIVKKVKKRGFPIVFSNLAQKGYFFFVSS